MRRIDITIGLLAVATVFYGAECAIGRERLRSTDPHSLYEQINRESFNGELPDASVKWSDLADDYGAMTLYSNDSAEIEIDRTVGGEREATTGDDAARSLPRTDARYR